MPNVIDSALSAYQRVRRYLEGGPDQEDVDAGVDIEDDLPDDDLIALWREQFAADLAADTNDREEAERDNIFVNAGDINKEQWDVAMKEQRIAAGRPVLQTNLTLTFVQQIVNEGSRNEPAIGISPGDDGTEENAEYFQGRIRQIEYNCDANTQWDRARDQQVTTSRGAVEVITKAIPGQDPGERQELGLKTIPNQFSVVWDRGAQEYDCSDADRVWVVNRITPAEHTRLFGKRTTLDTMPFTEAASQAPDWVGLGSGNSKSGTMIQVAKLIKKRFKTQVKLANGEWQWEDKIPSRRLVPVERTDKRKELYCIAVYMFNGVEILPPPAGPPPDEPDARYSKWLTLEIPLVPIWGPEAVVSGEKRRRSLVRPAKDAQRMVNFCDSSIAELIGQMPKAPWLVEFGSIPKGHENYWAEINTTPRGFLYWLGIDPATGRPLNKPTREIAEPPIQALTIAREQAVQAMKAAMGIFDAARGDRSNETSGVAIERRQQQSGIVNYHFPRNENRTRKRIGEILVNAIKKLDAEEGEYPIREADGTTVYRQVGRVFEDPKTKKPTLIDLKGNYTLVVNTTVNFETARKEERAFLADAIKADPTLLWIMGDKFFALSDVPGSKEMADRMKAAINLKTPGLIPDAEEGAPAIPPEIQQQMQAYQREAAEAKAFAEEQLNKVKVDEAKQTGENERKVLDIDFQREKLDKELEFKREELATKANLEQAKLGMQEAIAELKAQIDVLNQQAGIANEVAAREAAGTQAEAARDHESAEAQQAREHEAQQADANRRLQSESQAADQDLQREMAERSEGDE